MQYFSPGSLWHRVIRLAHIKHNLLTFEENLANHDITRGLPIYVGLKIVQKDWDVAPISRVLEYISRNVEVL